MALPVGAVRDAEVEDIAVVAGAIRQLWTQAKFSTKKVVVGVANQKVVVRQVDLPWQPLSELKKSLACQAQDFIPMPVEQAILDFHPLEEFHNDGGGRMLRVLLVAASREMVTSALAAVEQAGLQPTMVDLTSFAVLRSQVRSSPGFAVEAEASLTSAPASPTSWSTRAAFLASSGLLMGGGDITDAVAERLGVDAEQAESVKQTTGLSLVAGGAQAHPANRAIESTGGAFVEGVRGSLDYYLAQSGSARIGRVVLSGGGSRIGGLVERLTTATRLPVEIARPMSVLKIGKTGLTDEQLAYVEPMVTVPVGLALGVAS